MAKTKIAVLWGVLIALMVACAGIYATLKAREMKHCFTRRLFAVQRPASRIRGCGTFGIFEQKIPTSMCSWEKMKSCIQNLGVI